jgi:hypothetical protein
MKKHFLLLAFGALALTAVQPASARLNVEIGINPFGFGYAPPVVYAPDPYYDEAPPVVYVGGGSWGGSDRGRRGGNRGGGGHPAPQHGGSHGGGKHR